MKIQQHQHTVVKPEHAEVTTLYDPVRLPEVLHAVHAVTDDVLQRLHHLVHQCPNSPRQRCRCQLRSCQHIGALS